MIQIFMVFPSKVGAPGHVSGMCSSLWTTWARKKVPEVNICIWEVHFGGCGGTGGPTAVRTSFAIVLICLTSRRSPAEESETPPSVVERCLCPQVDDSEPQLWPRAGLGSGLKALRMIHGRDQCTRQVSLENRSADGRCASCGEDICCGGRGRAGVEKAAATEEAYAGPTAAALQAVALLTAPGGRFVAKTRGLRCGGNPMWLSPSSSIPHRRPPEPRQRSPEQHVPAGLHRRNPQQRLPDIHPRAIACPPPQQSMTAATG